MTVLRRAARREASNAAHQAAWRKRQADRLKRYETALWDVLDKVGKGETPIAKEIRTIAEQALNPPKTPIKDTGDE